MPDKRMRFLIDWFRMSFDSDLRINTPLRHIRAAGFEQGGMIKAGKFYNRAMQLLPCGRFDWHSENMQQGALLTLTGNDLAIIRQHPRMTVDGVIKAMLAVPGAKATRIDFAWDIEGFEADPDDLFEAWEQGRMRTHAKKAARFVDTGKQGETLGKTVYIGSRTSQQMVRAYDKAKEQGIEGDWLRVELEAKGPKAHSAARAEVKYGPVTTALGAINDFIKIDGVEWWDIAMQGRIECDIETNPRKETEGKKWLYNVALPKVLEAARDGDAAVISALRSLNLDKGSEVG